MAVYYIDPYTTTNGTGTWASPFSFTGAKTGLILYPGDEFRIVAKYLTSILTATAYVASRSAVNTITITSGGGLGADFVVGDFVYFTDYDSFARVNSKTTNTLTLSGTSVPIPVSTSSLTVSLNVRKLDTTVATPSTVNTTLYTWGDPSIISWENITVTDGWVADGVRVTDGTAKSLLRSTSTSSTAAWYMDTQLNTSQNEAPYRNSTANLPHTHYLGNNTTITTLSVYCYAIATLNINQLYASNGQSAVVTSAASSGSYTPKNLNFTFKHVSFSATAGLLAIDSTLTVTNFYTTTGLVVFSNFYSSTANITYVLANSVTNNTLAATATGAVGAVSTWNVGTIDIYAINGPSNAITGQLGGFTLNIANPILAGNGGTVASVAYRWAPTNSSILATYPVVALPRINTTVVTFTNSMSVLATFFNAPTAYFTWTVPEDIPTVYTLSCYHATTNRPNWYFASANLLVTQADGTAPYELLGVTGPVPNGIFGAAASQFPLVTTDATFFRTAGPSIKIYLGTIVTPGYWISGWATKNIKIPVVSGTSYTVAGYLRTDQTTFVSGNAVASIVNRYGTVVSQSMTTACINAWAGFSLSFTATQTEEVYLAIKVRFTEGVKSFWLDDLTIV